MAKKKRGFVKYKSYLFVEKDPVIDAMRTAFSDAKVSYQDVSNESSVATATIRNWFHGRTRRPQFATTAAVTRALGKKGIMFNGKGTPYLVD
jgi:hypothetical protein